MATFAPETLRSASTSDYSEHVNPQWVRLLNLLQMNVRISVVSARSCSPRMAGASSISSPAIAFTIPGTIIPTSSPLLRTNSIAAARRCCRAMCRIWPECWRSGCASLLAARLTKAFFACSGSEGVETAIKFARNYTGRTGLLYADGAFHGLTCGALSMMGDPFWRDKFGPMLPDTGFGSLRRPRRV